METGDFDFDRLLAEGLDPAVLENCTVEDLTQAEPPQFEILNVKEHKVKKYDTIARVIRIKFRDLGDGENFREYIQSVFTNLLEYLRSDVEPNDRVGLSISSSARPEQRSIGVSLRAAKDLSVDTILNIIEKVVQSNETFFIDGSVEVRVVHVKMPVGLGRARTDKVCSFDDYCKKKAGIVVINNNDTLCLARALVVAIARCHRDESVESKKTYNIIINKTRDNLQLEKAQELCAAAGVDLTNGGGLDELRAFQNHLTDYCITVYDDRRGSSVMFEGVAEGTAPKRHLDLTFAEGHFNVITSLTSAFSTSYYCRTCRKSFDHHYMHRCALECMRCKRNSPCVELDGYAKTCDDCNRFFLNPTCYSNHKTTDPDHANRVICNVLKCCSDCKKIYHTKSNEGKHVCNEAFCSVCECYKPAGHLCFIKPYIKKPNVQSRKFMYIYFDFECSQDTPVNNVAHSYEHKPNYCVAQNVCYVCHENEDISEVCGKCGVRQHSGESTLTDFMEYVRMPRTQFSKLILLAHNMKSYDGQFTLKHMIEQFKWTPQVIMNGSKIQMITYDRLKVIDSLNYFSTKLSALPKMFDLNCENKGHFPHYFNRKENWMYKGPLPEAKDFGCDDMASGDRQQFLTWYAAQKESGYVFDFQQEIKKYCIQDVTILRLACLKFRHLFLKENDVDPFSESVTIASAAMTTFRKKYMEKESIGVIPAGGYRLADPQSKVAILWLEWEEFATDRRIRHAANGREARVCGYKVDGYYETAVGEKTVYEFNGCWYHGCRMCFKDREAKLHNSPNETMNTRYERTMKKKATIQSQGYKYVEMWECQFKLMRAQNPNLRHFLAGRNAAEDIDPLNPRDALYGGRTNATKLFYEVRAGEKIRYLDVCSLYPWACKYGKFPTGHPTVLVGTDCPQDLQNIEGIVKATLLPPPNLYHPVLPVRVHNRLFFPLCRRCVEERCENDCNHNAEERSITGTWVVDEVKKAVSLGYSLVKVHEVWSYSTTQYDGQRGGLFAKYMDNFLKLKQEASGWPDWCRTDDEKERYIHNFQAKEGITLNKDSICKNPGFRALAKMLLNSLWGKFAQRSNLSRTSFLNTKEELTTMLSDPNIEVADLVPVNDDVMMASWSYAEDSLTPSPMTNVVIAAYVTTIARLKLYSYLEELEERVLYFDTDSVIFVERPDKPSPPVGDFLGDLTDEVACYGEGSYIDAFVSGGPKNYSYRIRLSDGSCKFVCKVKGINLNYRNSQLVNFDLIKRMVLNETEQPVVLHSNQIRRTGVLNVVTRPEKKTYRVVYTKRRRVEEYDTVPYGYVKRQRFD